MEQEQQHHHFLLVNYPAQGHINPTLQLAQRLTNIGVHVTFLVNTYTRRRMIQVPDYKNFTLFEFSDGYDDGRKLEEYDAFMYNFKRKSTHALTEVITTNAELPITCLVYSLLVPWAAELARDFKVPSALFWIQPAMVFDVYYSYFNRIDDIDQKINGAEPILAQDTSWSITFQNLPLAFTMRDLPSLLSPTNIHKAIKSLFQEHMEILGQETNPKVLVNTFDALEPNALSAISDVHMVSIGPMVPSENSSNISLFEPSDRKYIDWLNTKPESFVVYISFGSLVVLSEKQVEEIQKGLLKSGKPCLWAMRTEGSHRQNEESPEEVDENMMIVNWCDQNAVLSHPSVGCFLTHCGWNSTLESIVAGKPMVGLPQWSDQGTIAKLVGELWKTGVRVNVNKDDDIASGDEVERCLEIFLGGGERGEEIRRNALKYKALAHEALRENTGSSNKNLQAFVDQLSTYIV